MIAHSFQSAEQYAAYLATYISSPLKIEKLVELDWTVAPPLHVIAQMRYEVEKASKPRRAGGVSRPNQGIETDHLDWQPKTFVPKAQPEPRRYANSRTVYTPVHVTLPDNDDVCPTIRSHTDVIAAVAKAFGLTYADLVGHNRKTKFVCARAVAAKILHERGNALKQIGRFMGGRDHQTIINLLHNFDARCRRFPEIAEVYSRLSAAPVAEAA